MTEALQFTTSTRLAKILNSAPKDVANLGEFKVIDGQAKRVSVSFDTRKYKTIELLMLTDVQWGSINCKEHRVKEFLDWILAVPNRFVFFGGDMIDAATVLSVGSPYENKYEPKEQMLRFIETFVRIRHRVLGYVGGNHEQRTSKAFGECGSLIATLLRIPYSAGKQLIDVHFGKHDPFKVDLWHGGGAARTKGARAQMIHRFMQQGDSQLYLCFAAGTPVLMADGSYKPIEKIQAGEIVITGSGNVAQVSKCFDREYTGPMCKIRAHGGTQPILITPNHPLGIWSKTAYGDHYFSPVDADKIGSGAWWQRGQLQNLPSIPSSFTAENMRLFGYYLSEGCVYHSKGNRQNQLSFCFNAKDEQHLAEDCQKLLADHGWRSSISTQKHNSLIVRCCQKTAVEFFESTMGKGCANKRVPDEWLFYPKEHLEQLLRGVFEGDGHKTKHYWRLQLTSPRLIEQCSFMLGRLGRVVSAMTWRKRPGRKIIYGIGYAHTETQTKGKRTQATQLGLASPFTVMEKVENWSGKVYNLQVNHADHTYIVDGFIAGNCGHLHDAMVLFDWRQQRKGNDIHLEKIAGCMSSSFLEFWGGYGERMGLAPSDTMMARCVLEPNGHWMLTLC